MLEQPHLAVIGTGVAGGTPDQCKVHVSLHHMAETAAEALSATAEIAINAIAGLADLAELGVDQCDVTTMGLSVHDFFDQEQQKVTARVASYEMDVVVRPIDGAGTVLSALAATAGEGLQVRGMQLTIQDPEPLRSEARRLAVHDAKRKAVELSDEAGVRLGALLSIQDEAVGSGTTPFIRRAMPTSTGFSAASLPIEAGDVLATSTVVLIYAIG